MTIAVKLLVGALFGLILPASALSQQDVDADPVPVIDKGACRATDVHRSGDRITWKLVCDGSLRAALLARVRRLLEAIDR